MSKHKIGDRVEVTTVGDITDVVGDIFGTSIYLDNGTAVALGETIQIRKVAPRKPEVGEVITGATLKATPWKQGTVIAFVDATSEPYMLQARGEWACPKYDDISFGEFRDGDRLKIVYLP